MGEFSVINTISFNVLEKINSVFVERQCHLNSSKKTTSYIVAFISNSQQRATTPWWQHAQSAVAT